MKIIALWGKGSIGKTTTLRMVYDKLKNHYGFQTILEPIRLGEKDFYTVLEKNGHKIGLTTAGDDEKNLTEPFDLFQKEKCDICITASRIRHTKGGSVLFLERIDNSEIIWHEKAHISRSSDLDFSKEIEEINIIQADFLIKELIRLL